LSREKLHLGSSVKKNTEVCTERLKACVNQNGRN